MDVETAYLQGNLNDSIYMHQPEGYISKTEPNKVCKLLKPIYGLKQGGRELNTKLNSELTKLGFSRSVADPCLYYQNKEHLIIIMTYVDDLLILSQDDNEIRNCKHQLQTIFKIKDLGTIQRFLGIRVRQDITKGTIQWTNRNTSNQF